MSGWDDNKWLMTVADTISHMYDKPLFLPMESIANLDWNDQISALADQLVLQKIIDSKNNVELVRGIVKVFKTQAQIVYNSPFEPRVPISMIRAKVILEGFLVGMPERHPTSRNHPPADYFLSCASGAHGDFLDWSTVRRVKSSQYLSFRGANNLSA